MKIRLLLRELEKTFLQYLLLPLAYELNRKKRVDNNLVILADSKHDEIPFSLKAMHKELQKHNFKILNFCCDYSKLSLFEKLAKSISFMQYYAQAKYVFICDYFLPVSSCNKKNETKVIQLWHASGLQKKFGYDAKDDLGSFLFVRPTKNFDLVSVSAECMRSIIAKNWRLPLENVQALGTSRSDLFFEEGYADKCRKKFYELYPDALGKKVVLWAPSFRGNGSDAEICDLDGILKLKESLDEEFFFIIKLHPHLQYKYKIDNCDMNTEELYAVTDILITDYSSVLYDYLLFGGNVFFYVPDYEEYIKTRGMYIDYREDFKYPVISKIECLKSNILKVRQIDEDTLIYYKKKYIDSNDGMASIRIINYLSKKEKW